MARFKHTSDGIVQFTADEETARDAEEKEWADGADARNMESIRFYRNHYLKETDWMANSDVTMSDAWGKYRQDLRDIPSKGYKTFKDVEWPHKPKE